MKTKIVKYFLTSFATATLFVAAATQYAVHAQDVEGPASDSDNTMVGAWETTVTPRNCENGEQIAPSFNGVITFNKGGTVAEFGANPATPHRTPGHGIWTSLGRRNSMRFTFIPLTPTGVPIGRMRVTQHGELSKSGDESTSSGYFELTSLGGVVLATGCSTATAVRLAF